MLLAGALLMSLTGNAQAAADATAAAPAVDNSINGLSPFTFYLMAAVITVEIAILIALVYQLKFLVGIESKRVQQTSAKAAVEKKKESWWWKINKSTAIEEEAAIDLSHDYDGISELDNKLPPWWIAAFALSILFGVGYLYRYHVAHSAPLQIEELQISMKIADEEKAAYLAKSANNVDENTVVMLDANGIASGKALFGANCVACHGQAGEGGVGPNLTDNYWLNGGKINDVFKTITYGRVEKGMRSWKSDFSPLQIAQLSSYVKSLKGTNPPNAKAPQGELYDENQAAPAKAVTDSTASAAGAK
jgi:cytochrome c oxidase cbb3-type subunit 3